MLASFEDYTFPLTAMKKHLIFILSLECRWLQAEGDEEILTLIPYAVSLLYALLFLFISQKV